MRGTTPVDQVHSVSFKEDKLHPLVSSKSLPRNLAPPGCSLKGSSFLLLQLYLLVQVYKISMEYARKLFIESFFSMIVAIAL